MSSSRLEHILVRHMTANQPFYAGVVLLHKGCLIVALNDDGLPMTMRNQGGAYRICGIDGRQEAGETIWDCTRRVAHKTLGCEIEFLSSSVTYFHDIDSEDVYKVGCYDPIAPLLLERRSNLYPYTPSRPGLPAGPYTYFGLFLAQAEVANIQPGEDVLGLLGIPLALWPSLTQQPTLDALLQQGAEIIGRDTLEHSRRLWMHPSESSGTIAALLQRHPELYGS